MLLLVVCLLDQVNLVLEDEDVFSASCMSECLD